MSKATITLRVKKHTGNTKLIGFMEVLMPRGSVLLPVYAFLNLKVTVAIDMHLMNQHATLVQLKYIFTVLLKKQCHLIIVHRGWNEGE